MVRARMPMAVAAETRPMVPPPDTTTVSLALVPPDAAHRVEAAGEGLDQGGLLVADAVGQLVQPFGTGGQVFAIGAVEREAEMMDAVGQLDHAFADDAVAALEVRDVAAGLDDLAAPIRGPA